jgi:hypothetical protein
MGQSGSSSLVGRQVNDHQGHRHFLAERQVGTDSPTLEGAGETAYVFSLDPLSDVPTFLGRNVVTRFLRLS